MGLFSGDGIYTLTLTDYPELGRYKFTITVDDNDMQSYVMRTHDEIPASTYDISTQHHDNSLQRLEPFTRSVYGPVVHLSHRPKLDVVPPSTIGDLSISLVDNRVNQ